MLFTCMWSKCTQGKSLSLAKGGHKIYNILLLCLCFMERELFFLEDGTAQIQ